TPYHTNLKLWQAASHDNAFLMTGRNFNKLLFFLIDGVPYDVFNALLESGELPNIKKHVIDRGSLRKAVSVFPSTTGPAFIPFFTGLFPGTANVPGIRWLSKKNYLKPHRFRSPGICSYMGLDGVNFNRDIMETKTLFNYFKNPANVYNLLTKGCPRKCDLTSHVKSLHYLYAFISRDFSFLDRHATKYTVNAVRNGHDCVVCLYPGIDEHAHLSHITSTRVINEYRKVDRGIGFICDELIRNKTYDQTLIVISSDHGLTNTHTHIDIARHLDDNGFYCLHFPKIWRSSAKTASMVSGNGMLNLYLRLGKREWGPRALSDEIEKSGLFDLLLDIKGIDIVACVDGQNNILVRNPKGTGKISMKDNRISYTFSGSDPMGYNKTFNDMDPDRELKETYNTEHPDGLLQLMQIFRSERAGDLVISARPGYDLRARFELHEHHATHGAINAGQMFVPFAMNAGINTEYVRTVDIFPSILEFFGHEFGNGLDGKSVLNKSA
ncbi:MAG: alkaline phosphatase family protein, partial [Oligoflexia bacterium]|nr:alkaline phosphatase family protein [Oligoflexia bacterium]